MKLLNLQKSVVVKMYFKLFLFLTCLVCLSGVSGATDYYVSTTGNNSNDGLTIENAFASMSYIIPNATAGDTIYVVTGTYNELDITFGNSGNLTHPIQLFDYNGTVTINASGPNFHTINAENKSFITIDGDFDIHSGYTGIDFQNSSNMIVRNVTVRDTIQAGIPIGIWFRDNTRNSIIESCTVDHVGWNGIMVYGSDYPPHAGQSTRASHDIIISNNTVRNNSIHNGIDVHTNNYNIQILNNEVYDNDGQIGIFIHSAQTMNRNITVHNNTVYNNSRGIYVHGTYNSTISNNTVYNHTESSKYGFGLTASPEDPGLQFNIPHNITFENNTAYHNYYNLYISNTDKTNYSAPNDINISNNRMDDATHSSSIDVLISEFNGKNLIFNNNNYNYSDNDIYIYIATSPANITVTSDYMFTDNSAFENASYYANGTGIAVGNVSAIFTSYSIQVIPNYNYIYNTLINLFNTSLDNYSITLESIVAENPTWINITTQNPSHEYDLYINDTFIETVTSNSDSNVNYNYSDDFTTVKTFELQYNSSLDWVISPTTIYQGFLAHIFSNGTIIYTGIQPNESSTVSNLKVII